jgi:hypothetical protein
MRKGAIAEFQTIRIFPKEAVKEAIYKNPPVDGIPLVRFRSKKSHPCRRIA